MLDYAGLLLIAGRVEQAAYLLVIANGLRVRMALDVLLARIERLQDCHGARVGVLVSLVLVLLIYLVLAWYRVHGMHVCKSLEGAVCLAGSLGLHSTSGEELESDSLSHQSNV